MSDTEKKEELTLQNYSSYKKSNFLISAKYKSNLIENKLMALSLSKIQEAYEDKEGSLTVKLPVRDIRKIFGTTSGSFYHQLEMAAKSLQHRQIGMSDPENERFSYHVVVQNSTYENGVLYIEYNKVLNHYLKDLKNNYTRLSLENMLKFKSVFSLRLYEILKSEMFTPKWSVNKSGAYRIEKSLAELKFEMGVIDASEQKVADIIIGKEHPDYEKAAEIATDKSYNTWGEFRRVALDPAVNEICTKTDIDVRYDTLNKGKGGKVIGVIFYAAPKSVVSSDSEEATSAEVVELDDMIDEVLALIEENIRIRDARAILEASGNNLNAIREVYEIAKSQKQVDNLVGFMITGLRNGYQKSPGISGTHKTDFHNFKQNEYDFNSLEKNLLNA